MTKRRIDEMAWSDLRVIMAIGRAGSLSGAARTLGCTHSTVFRRIGALEESLGVRFFERLPSGYELTEAGMVAMRYAARIEGEFDALHREVSGLDTELSGHIIVTAPAIMSATLLPPWLAEFRSAHPGVRISLIAGHQNLDLRRRQADLAIRATANPPPDAIGRRLCDFRFGFYASEAFLAEQGDRPMDEMDFVALEGIVDWFIPAIWKNTRQAERQVVFSSDNAAAAIAAARASAGMLPMSCYACAPYADLVRVDFFPPKDMGLWVLVHPDLRRTSRVKALKEFLTGKLLEQASQFDGSGHDDFARVCR